MDHGAYLVSIRFPDDRNAARTAVMQSPLIDCKAPVHNVVLVHGDIGCRSMRNLRGLTSSRDASLPLMRMCV